MLDNDGRDHHETHQELLAEAGNPPPAWPGLDAIVVPTIRPPSSLAEAAKLAQILNCALVTLHSGPLTTAESAPEWLPADIELADIDLIAIDVPQSLHLLRLPPWETSSLLMREGFARSIDVSTKRNLALMLSRMLDWSRILFLDDDITAPNPDDIRRASGLLETHNAVGLRIGGFPDNSVVCHAYRRAGGPQESFIGSGALAVETERCTSFFPDIYNDDWLFMLDPDGLLQPVACTGEVCQAPFDPFRTADRARTEELGDVLAEGVYWLLDQDQSVFEADKKHWDEFLVKRRKFIIRVLDMVRRRVPEGSEKNRIVDALTGSLGQLVRIRPDVCQRYLQAWATDRKLWHSHMSGLPTGQERQQAINLLSARGAPLTRFLTKDRAGNRVPLGTALWSPS